MHFVSKHNTTHGAFVKWNLIAQSEAGISVLEEEFPFIKWTLVLVYSLKQSNLFFFHVKLLVYELYIFLNASDNGISWTE